MSDDLSLISSSASRHPAYPSFAQAVAGRVYGGQALNDAWYWFRTGWELASKQTAPTVDFVDRVLP